MRSLDRFTTPQAAVALQQITPDQREFQRTQAGRTAGDYATGTVHQAYRLRVWPDGTCDLVRLDNDGRDYLDNCGHGARDVAAGRI